MSVKIRLRRMGTKKRAFYRVVAADSRAPRDGKNLETLGHYNPVTKPAMFDIDEAKVTHWLDNGAQMSDTVRSLCTQVGFIEKYEKAKRGEDVSGIQLKSVIKERKKKRKRTKAAAETTETTPAAGAKDSAGGAEA